MLLNLYFSGIPGGVVKGVVSNPLFQIFLDPALLCYVWQHSACRSNATPSHTLASGPLPHLQFHLLKKMKTITSFNWHLLHTTIFETLMKEIETELRHPSHTFYI